MKAFPIVALISLLIGCATSGNPRVAQEEVLAQIILGQTTKEEVRQLLGPPQGFTKSLIEGLAQEKLLYELWIYHYHKVETNPALFIPFVGLAVVAACGGVESQFHSLTIGFSSEGIVKSVFKHGAGTNSPDNTPTTMTDNTDEMGSP